MKLASIIKKLPAPLKKWIVSTVFSIIKFISVMHRREVEKSLSIAERLYGNVLIIEREVSFSFYKDFRSASTSEQMRLLRETFGWELDAPDIREWEFDILANNVVFPHIDFQLKGAIAFKTKNGAILWKLTYGGAA